MSYLNKLILPPLSATLGFFLWKEFYDFLESNKRHHELQINRNFKNDLLQCLSGYLIFTTGGFFFGKYLANIIY